MKTHIIFLIIVMVILALPPWKIAWVTADKKAPPISQEQEFGGFHFYHYRSVSMEKTIAWDGEKGGGKFTVYATPSIKLDWLIGELLIVVIIWFGTTWKLRRRSSGV